MPFEPDEAKAYAATFTGLLVVGIITWVPYTGLLVGVVAKTVGLGAAAAALTGNRRAVQFLPGETNVKRRARPGWRASAEKWR